MPPAAIDHDRLHALIEDIGAEIFAAILEEFYLEAGTAIDELSQAAAANDANRARQLLHLMTGSAGNIGAANLVRLSQEARMQLDAGAPPAHIDLPAFRAALQTAQSAFAQLNLA